jgi:hypothetical protein
MTNNFSLGAQVGGPDAGDATRQDEQELRDVFNRWQGMRHLHAIGLRVQLVLSYFVLAAQMQTQLK